MNYAEDIRLRRVRLTIIFQRQDCIMLDLSMHKIVGTTSNILYKLLNILMNTEMFPCCCIYDAKEIIKVNHSSYLFLSNKILSYLTNAPRPYFISFSISCLFFF